MIARSMRASDMIITMQPDPFALPAFILSIVGLSVATIGAATGVAALSWQIVTRTRGAHRVKVRAIPGMMLMGEHFNEGPFVEVQIANSGAAAVQVRQWSIVFPDKTGMVVAVPEPLPIQPSLPYMLEAGTRVSLFTRASAVAKALNDRDIRTAQIQVHLATGQTVRSKRGQIRLE